MRRPRPVRIADWLMSFNAIDLTGAVAPAFKLIPTAHQTPHRKYAPWKPRP
jgi:hypothetical protein